MQADKFVELIKSKLAAMEPTPAWYPGTQAVYERFLDLHDNVTTIPASKPTPPSPDGAPHGFETARDMPVFTLDMCSQLLHAMHVHSSTPQALQHALCATVGCQYFCRSVTRLKCSPCARDSSHMHQL